MKKLSIFLLLTCLTYSANAAFWVCNYHEEACDSFGNQFLCSFVGWTGPNPPQYCSPTDQSTGPQSIDEREFYFEED